MPGSGRLAYLGEVCVCVAILEVIAVTLSWYYLNAWLKHCCTWKGKAGRGMEATLYKKMSGSLSTSTVPDAGEVDKWSSVNVKNMTTR